MHHTGTTDYVVDALALHDHLGDALRPLFASDRILKVLCACVFAHTLQLLSLMLAVSRTLSLALDPTLQHKELHTHTED